MRKNELLRKDGSIIRILAAEGDEVLCITCRGISSPMPGWCRASEFEDYSPCSEDELQEALGMELVPEDGLKPDERNTARQRYTIIAPVLGCLEDEKIRAQMIGRTAKEHGVIKQTIRNYLKLYLTVVPQNKVSVSCTETANSIIVVLVAADKKRERTTLSTARSFSQP